MIQLDPIHYRDIYLCKHDRCLHTSEGTLMFVVSPVTKCGTKEFITEEVPFYFLCALDLMF